jgi:hypothetical protein
MADDIYQIRVKGHLDVSWSEWLGGMALTQGPDGVTTLTGPVADQAALYGLLHKTQALNLTLLSLVHASEVGNPEFLRTIKGAGKPPGQEQIVDWSTPGSGEKAL